MRTRITILACAAIILVSAIFGYRALFPSAPPKAHVVKTVAEGRVIAMSGKDYLLQLWREGRLPGTTTNEHGNATVSGQLASYPYTLTARITITGEMFTNNYTIVQNRKGSPWQLKRAWQTGPDGQVVQVWTVK